jgi:hypothetical protein
MGKFPDPRTPLRRAFIAGAKTPVIAAALTAR